MQTATEAPASGASGTNPEPTTVYQNSYQWRLPVVPASRPPKPERSQSEYQREFKWHPSPSATPSPAPATPTPATPTPQTPEPTRTPLPTEPSGADAVKLATTLAKTQAAAELAPQSPASIPIDTRHNGRLVREPEQMSTAREPIAAGMPTKMDSWNLSMRNGGIAGSFEGRQQTILSSALEGKTKKIVALEANRLSKKSRSYSMYSLSDQLKTAEAANELVNLQESEYKREFVNWAEYGDFAREELPSAKSAKSELRRRGSWSGSLPTPLKWLEGFQSQEISKLQPAIPDSKSSRAPLNTPKRPKTSAEFRNYHDFDYDDFAFESRPKSSKALGRTDGFLDGKLDDSPYRNSSDDIYSVTDSKARRDPYHDERRRDRDYDDRLSETASYDRQRDRYDVRSRDHDYDMRSRDRDYDVRSRDRECDERRRDHDYYDRQVGTAHNSRDRYDDHARERDHDLRNEYSSRRDDRYDRSRDRDYDDRHSETTHSDRRGDRYDGRSRDRDYDDRRGEARYSDRIRERDYDGRTESRVDNRYSEVDRRSESRYGDRRSDRYEDRPNERDYGDRVSDSRYSERRSESRYGERRSDAPYEEKQDAPQYGSGPSSRQAPDEGRHERNGHSRNTSYSSQLSRGSGELSQPQSPAHPLSHVDNFRSRARSSLSSNSSVSTPSSPPTPNGYDSADPRWRKSQGIYKEQLYSGVYSKEGPMYDKERWQGYPSKDQTPLRRGYYYDEDEEEDEAIEMPSRSRRDLGNGSHRSTRSPSPTSDYRKYNRRDFMSPNLSPAYSSRPASRATSVSSHSTSIEEESAVLTDMLREADNVTLKSLTDRLSIFRVSRESRDGGLGMGFDTSIPTASTKRGSTTTKPGAKATNARGGTKTAATTKAGAKTTTATRTGAKTTAAATKTGLKTASTASKTSSAASSRRSSVMNAKAPMSPVANARKGHRPVSSAASSISSNASLRSLGSLGMNERIPANSFSEARQALGRARAKVEEMLELVSNGSYDF